MLSEITPLIWKMFSLLYGMNCNVCVPLAPPSMKMLPLKATVPLAVVPMVVVPVVTLPPVMVAADPKVKLALPSLVLTALPKFRVELALGFAANETGAFTLKLEISVPVWNLSNWPMIASARCARSAARRTQRVGVIDDEVTAVERGCPGIGCYFPRARCSRPESLIPHRGC